MRHRTRKLAPIEVGALGVAAAVLAAVALRDPAIEQWHLLRLRSGDDAVRERAAERLVEIGSTRAIPVLVEIFRASPPIEFGGEHHWSLRALVELGEPAVPRLLGELACDSEYVRVEVGAALREMPSLPLPALIGALGHESANVRGFCSRKIEELGPAARAAVPALVRNLFDRRLVPDAELAALEAIGPDPAAAEGLERALRDGSVRPPIRLACARALIHHGAAGRAALLDALRDADGLVRRAAVDAAGLLFGGEDVVPALVDLLADPDPWVRRQAIESLGYFGEEAAAAVPAIARFLRGAQRAEEGSVTAAAALALGRIGPPAAPAVPRLLELLGEEEEHIRAAAAFALRHLGAASSEHLPALTPALVDPSPDVRIDAALAIASMGPEAAGAADAVPVLVRACRLTRPRLAEEPVEGLVFLGDPNDGVILDAIRRIGPAAVPRLVAILRDGVALELRVRAAAILGSLGTSARDAVPALVATVEDAAEPADLRIAALAALGALGAEHARAVPLPALIATIRNGSEPTDLRRDAIAALGVMAREDGGALAALIATVEDAEAPTDLRVAAVHALGRTGPAAVPALAGALAGENEEISRAAISALGDLGAEAGEALPRLLEKVGALLSEGRLWGNELGALGRVGRGSPEVAAFLGKVLEIHADYYHGSKLALRALVLVGRDVDGVVPLLEDALREGSRLREEAARALVRLGERRREVRDVLVGALRRGDGDHLFSEKLETAIALSAFDSELDSVIPVLVAHIDRDGVLETLERFPERSEEIVRRIVEGLGSEPPGLPEIPALRSFARKAPALLPRVASVLAGALHETWSFEEGEAALAALEALAPLPPAAAPVLERARKTAILDDDFELRRRLTALLRGITDPSEP